MANQEQLKILKSGVKEWNEWRGKNPKEKIDLSGADLFEMDLSGANLFEANLSGVDLICADLAKAYLGEANLRDAVLFKADLDHASLRGANLSKSDFRSANLSKSDFREVDLFKANLGEANLSEANLFKANLFKAVLFKTNLSGANLKDADLRDAVLDKTIFALQDLSTCKGLESVKVRGKCSIDYEILTTSKNLPKSFLKKIGLPDIFIDYLPEFRDSSPIKLFPVFLSHSWKNKDFAAKLYNTLIDKDVQVWYDEKKMRPGDDILESISKGIGVYDKTLLVCSQESLESWWVKREVNRLFEKERKYQKETKSDMGLLIPITIDDYLYKAESGLANAIKERVVGDFTQWKEPEVFDREVQKLVDALNVDRKDRDPTSFLGLDQS